VAALPVPHDIAPLKPSAKTPPGDRPAGHRRPQHSARPPGEDSPADAPREAHLLPALHRPARAPLQHDTTHAVARDFRALALAHPHVVPLLVTRPLATPLALRPPGTLRPLEDILALLTRAGFNGPDALHIYRALFGFLHGHVLDELQELTVSTDETDDLLRLGLHRLPIGDFPLLRSLAPVLASYDGGAELERGLDILLTGLTTTLTPSRPHPPADG